MKKQIKVIIQKWSSNNLIRSNYLTMNFMQTKAPTQVLTTLSFRIGANAPEKRFGNKHFFIQIQGPVGCKEFVNWNSICQ